MDPFALNVLGVQSLISDKTNKVEGVFSNDEGVESEKFDVLDLPMSDDELLDLKDKWEGRYVGYEAIIEKRQQANKIYYLGGQMQGSPFTSDFPVAPNLQWEAAETFYAAALAKNPDPVVFCDNTPEGNKQADSVKTMLQYHAESLGLRPKLTRMTRQWSIYTLGVEKYGWDKSINEVSIDVRKIQDFIFDKDGSVDCYGHFDSYLGERITVSAEKLIELFPKHKEEIVIMVDGKLGTECTYTEWWTDEYCFSTFKEIVLDKHKNEFFNYDENKEPVEGEIPAMPARNHFAKPIKPYTFLSVYSLGEQPHDITGLIEQNIPNQNRITKRTMQIDRNLSHQNNFVAFSEDNFNQQTAKQALAGPELGHGILVPEGVPIEQAIVRFPAEGFPDAAFTEVETTKEDMKSSWGILGTASQQQNDDTTARGMILNQQRDNTRIGGSIGDALEIVAKDNFNWLVQLYYVFYDENHFAAVLGNLQAVEYTELSQKDLNKKLMISVSPDSMKSKDSLTEMNQAISFYEMGAIGPKTLLRLADFPDPDESAADGVLWKVDPNAYMQINWPELAQQLQQMQQAQAQAAAQAQMAQQQQEMQMQGQSAEQQMGHKEAAHKQKLSHSQEVHAIKMAQQKDKAPATTAQVPEPANLSSVPLPK